MGEKWNWILQEIVVSCDRNGGNSIYLKNQALDSWVVNLKISTVCVMFRVDVRKNIDSNDKEDLLKEDETHIEISSKLAKRNKSIIRGRQ